MKEHKDAIIDLEMNRKFIQTAPKQARMRQKSTPTPPLINPGRSQRINPLQP